jgi:hypothetical protein
MDTYTFSASAGDMVLVRMTKSSGNIWPGIAVYSPDGTKLCETYGSSTAKIASCALPSTGTYSILAYDGFNGTYTGNYSLYLQQNGSIIPVPIIFSVPQEIEVTSDLPAWFQVEVLGNTENLFFTLQKYSSWSGELKLYSGTQVLVSTSDYADQILRWPSPTPGKYLVEVSGSGSGRLTAYTALPELPLGQWVVGSILHQWGSAWYQFTVPPGQSSVYIRVETIGLWSQLHVYRGALDGTLVGSASGPTMNLEIPFPAPGIYYVYLADSAWIEGSSQTRDHMIRADTVPIEPPPCTTPLIASISPTKGGTAGPVSVRINGQCLVPQSSVCLTRQDYSNVCATTVISSDNDRTLDAMFDLTTTAQGNWNLAVTDSYSQSVTAPMSFTVESGGEVKLWVDILGRDQVRVGRWSTYVVRYGNNGTVDANFVYLALSAPAVLAVDVDLPWLMTEDANPWPGNSSDPDELFATLIYLPSVPSGSQSEFEVRFLSNVTADALIINADITTNPNPYLPDIPDDPLSFLGIQGRAAFPVNATDPVPNLTLPYHPPRDCSANPPSGFILVWKNAKGFNQHVAKSTGGGEYIEMVPGGIKTGPVSEYVSDGSCTAGYQGAYSPPWWSEADATRVQETAQRIKELNRPNDDPQDMIKDVYNWDDPKTKKVGKFCDSEFSPLNLQTNTPATIKTNCLGFVEFLNPQFETERGNVGTPWDWPLDPSLPNASKSNAGTVKKGDPCRKAFDNGDATKALRSITSISPEDKYGPTGYDAPETSASQLKRWIPAGQPLDYRIDFWNKEDAPAATVDVIITDTLDSNLDWSTFKFTEIGFLDWRMQLEPSQYFKVDVPNVSIDLSRYYTGQPTVTMVVNVEGTFDPISGTIRWEFHALDPVTRQPPENPYAGFLPPITDSGWEIGWVNFSVSPKPGLASGTVISNQAFVKFDVDVFKPAPAQGPFVNTLDALPPASAVQSPTGTQSCNSFPVTWSGQDEQNGSGLRIFDVYVDDLGDASPAYLWLANTTATFAVFQGSPGHRYGFYTRARDNVGNVEAIPEPFRYDVEATAGTYCVYLPLILKNKP